MLQLQLFGSHTTLATDVKSRLSLSLPHSLFFALSKLQLLPNESRSNANNKKKKRKAEESRAKAVEFVLKPKSGTQLMFSFNCKYRQTLRERESVEERGVGKAAAGREGGWRLQVSILVEHFGGFF